MLTAHKKGVCVVGVFAKDIAETKAARGTEAGAARGYPLALRHRARGMSAAADRDAKARAHAAVAQRRSASARRRSATCSTGSTTPRRRRLIEAAWDGGARYFDTSPWYGRGQAEHSLGRALYRRPRDDYRPLDQDRAAAAPAARARVRSRTSGSADSSSRRCSTTATTASCGRSRTACSGSESARSTSSSSTTSTSGTTSLTPALDAYFDAADRPAAGAR